MYQNIIKKITTLIEMANSSNTYESLQSELKVIQKDLLKCEREIEKYKITTNESKYIKASDKLIDENMQREGIGYQSDHKSFEKLMNKNRSILHTPNV